MKSGQKCFLLGGTLLYYWLDLVIAGGQKFAQSVREAPEPQFIGKEASSAAARFATKERARLEFLHVSRVVVSKLTIPKCLARIPDNGFA